MSSSYIGAKPVDTYSSLAVQHFTTSATASYSLSQSVTSENDIRLIINGVVQQPGASYAYTCSGTSLTLSSAITSSDTMHCVFIGKSIGTINPPDSSVGLAKLTASGTASSSTFLRGDNSWATPAGGSWVLIGTSVASTSASLDQTGLDSTYDTYAIVLADMIPSADGDVPYIRMGDSGGIDSGATDYNYHWSALSETGATYGGVVSTGASYIRLGAQIGSAAGEGFGAVLYLTRPGDGSMVPMITGTTTSHNQNGNYFGGAGFGSRDAVITLDRIQFLFSSGNITSGRMSVYGISHT
jgi:hypothetical protein